MGSRGLRQEERNGTEKLSSWFFCLEPWALRQAVRAPGCIPARRRWTRPAAAHTPLGRPSAGSGGEFLKFPVRRSQTPRESCGPASQRLGSASLGHTWLPQGNGQTSPPPTSPTPHSPSVVKTRASRSLAPSSTSP